MRRIMGFRYSIVALCVALAAPVTASAAETAGNDSWTARPALGLTLGYTSFADISGLGNSFFKEDVADDAPAFGVRIGYPFNKNVSAEIDLGYMGVDLRGTTTPGTGDRTATVLTAMAQVRYSIMPQKVVSPFITAGAGEMIQMTNKEYVKDLDNDLTYTVGAGLEAKLGFRLRGRLDVRWLASEGRPEKKDPDTQEVVEEKTTLSNHMQVLVGISYLIGGPDEDSDGDGLSDDKDKCPKKPEDKDGWQDTDGCPDIDNDGDGVVDTADKCPNEAEDKDGFKDKDGCPEADNDGDGINDASDKCPNKPEDKDGFKDNDGCPDLDNDRDGIPDAKDRCRNKPEDRDNFQDKDGCPDPDNDRDGIPDGKDKCPLKPETINGLADEDGCPDQLPDHVARLFDGPVKKVKFGRKDKLKRKSAAVLEKLLELMLENDKIRIEIHVHVDGKGKPAKMKAKSLTRATAIRKFYVDAGIDASRFVLFGHGNAKPLVEGKKRKARKKNTRVEFKIAR